MASEVPAESSFPGAAALALAGALITKGYLQRGHSTFLPTSFGSLMAMTASQLGHACLKPALTAMSFSRNGATACHERFLYLNRGRWRKAKGFPALRACGADALPSLAAPVTMVRELVPG